MTMTSKMLRAFVASVAGLAAAVAVMAVNGQPGAALNCQRSVAIDPQATVSETADTLTFTVQTGSCAAAGSVSYLVADGTARRPGDFQLSSGVLQWAAGDTSSRQIRAFVTKDTLTEPLLEDFTVTLTNPSVGVRVAAAVGQGRIFDNDTSVRAAAIDGRVCLLGTGPSSAGPLLASPTPGPTVTPCTIEPGNIVSVPFTVNTPNPTDQAVLFSTADGDLIANIDYVPVQRMVVIPAGATTVYVEVKLLSHAFTQDGKYFNVNISNYTAGTVVAGNARVTVLR